MLWLLITEWCLDKTETYVMWPYTGVERLATVLVRCGYIKMNLSNKVRPTNWHWELSRRKETCEACNQNDFSCYAAGKLRMRKISLSLSISLCLTHTHTHTHTQTQVPCLTTLSVCKITRVMSLMVDKWNTIKGYGWNNFLLCCAITQLGSRPPHC